MTHSVVGVTHFQLAQFIIVSAGMALSQMANRSVEFSQLEDSAKLDVIREQLYSVRAEHQVLIKRLDSGADLSRHMEDQINTLQRTVDGLTNGKLASPLTHEVDRRVTRIESYIESDRALKAEMGWWFRTLGAAAVVALAGQLWAWIKGRPRLGR